jgi:hypothetical protein
MVVLENAKPAMATAGLAGRFSDICEAPASREQIGASPAF